MNRDEGQLQYVISEVQRLTTVGGIAMGGGLVYIGFSLQVAASNFVAAVASDGVALGFIIAGAVYLGRAQLRRGDAQKLIEALPEREPPSDGPGALSASAHDDAGPSQSAVDSGT